MTTFVASGRPNDPARLPPGDRPPAPLAAPASEPEGAVRGELRKLVHDLSHYLAGVSGSMALGLISFPIFTRLLPVAEFGLIDLVQKILIFVTAVAKLGLGNSALRFYNKREFAADPEAERRYYATMFFGSIAPAFLSAAVFAAAVALLPASALRPDLAGALLISAILVVPRGLQTMFWSFLRVEDRTKLYNILVVVMKAAGIAAVWLLIHWTRPTAQVYFTATAVAETLVVAGIMVPLLRRGLLSFSRIDRAVLVSAVSFGAPLVVNEIAFVVLDAGDRVLIGHFLGADALGIYAAAYGLAGILYGVVMTPLNLAVLPAYLRLWAAGEREKTIRLLSTGLDLLMLGGMGLFAIFAVTAREVVWLTASSKYAGAEALIPTIFAGLLIFSSYVFVNAGLMIQKQTARIALVMTASAVVNIVLNCVLLPWIGLRGAALATLLSYAACILMMARASYPFLPLAFDWRAALGYGAAAGAAWAISARLHLEPLLWSAAAKASLCAVIYAALVWLMTPKVRRWTKRSRPARRAAA